MVSLITATNAMMSRNGTYDVERTPSVLFFFALVYEERLIFNVYANKGDSVVAFIPTVDNIKHHDEE